MHKWKIFSKIKGKSGTKLQLCEIFHYLQHVRFTFAHILCKIDLVLVKSKRYCGFILCTSAKGFTCHFCTVCIILFCYNFKDLSSNVYKELQNSASID